MVETKIIVMEIMGKPNVEVVVLTEYMMENLSEFLSNQLQQK